MDIRKNRIIGALAMATMAAVIIQEGRGISPGLSHLFVAGAFVAAILGAVGYGFRLRRDAEWDRIQRETATASGAWDVRQNWRGDFLVIDRSRGITSLFAGSRPGSPEPITAGPVHGPVTPTATDHRNLFDVLAPLDRVLVIGGMGTGKSELLKHLAAYHASVGECSIIDTHASPWTWPHGRVVGRGRDYPAAEVEILSICEEMDRRYQLRATGEQVEFPPLCLIVDEMTVLNQFVDVRDRFKSLLCECRKVNIRLIVAGQSDRAGALGLAGNYDLRAGYEAVVYLERTPDGRRQGRVFLGASKEAEVFDHPGIFPGGPCRGVAPSSDPDFHHDDHDTRDNHDNRDTHDTPRPSAPLVMIPDHTGTYRDENDARIWAMHCAGETPSSIARAIYGYSNGRTVPRVTAAISRIIGEAS